MALKDKGPNKNQTATERAEAAQALSGKTCSKCGEGIKLKDLVNVASIDMGTRKRQMLPYHRGCYTIGN